MITLFVEWIYFVAKEWWGYYVNKSIQVYIETGEAKNDSVCVSIKWKLSVGPFAAKLPIA